MKVRIVKEVKRSDVLWRFACGDVLITLYQLVVQGIDLGADFSLLSLEPKPHHMNNHTIYLHEGHINMTLNQEHTTKTTLVWWSYHETTRITSTITNWQSKQRLWVCKPSLIIAMHWHSCFKWPLEEIYNLIFERLTYSAILVPNWNILQQKNSLHIFSRKWFKLSEVVKRMLA